MKRSSKEFLIEKIVFYFSLQLQLIQLSGLINYWSNSRSSFFLFSDQYKSFFKSHKFVQHLRQKSWQQLQLHNGNLWIHSVVKNLDMMSNTHVDNKKRSIENENVWWIRKIIIESFSFRRCQKTKCDNVTVGQKQNHHLKLSVDRSIEAPLL